MDETTVNEPEEVEETQEVEDTEELEQEESSQDLDNEDVAEESEELIDESEEVEDELSPRQQKRVDQIERKAEELKLNKILDRIKRPQQTSSDQPMDYRQAIDAPDEVYETLDNDRQSYGQQRYNEGLDEAKAIEFRTNIKLDLPLVKDSLDKLDPADAESLDREYLQMVGFDPQTGFVQNSDIGYADFIEARIEQAERLASKLHLKSQKNIAKQAAQTGIRPDGGAHKGLKISSPQDIADMSAADFEKNKAAIYKAAGLPYNK